MKKTAILAALSCLSFVRLALAEPLYLVKEIPLVDPSGLGQAAFGINDLGQVVGYENINTSGSMLRPFIWDAKNGSRELGGGALGEGQIIVRDINNNGTAVGSNRVFLPSAFEYGFTVSAKGKIELFSPFDPYQILQPLGINDSDQFYGSLIQYGMPRMPSLQFLYTPGIGFEYIDPPIGFPYIHFNDINDNSPIDLVGTANSGLDGVTLPIKWNPAQGIQFLPLPANHTAWNMCTTNAGDTVGVYREMFVGQVDTLALWPAGGGRIDLAQVDIADYFFNILDVNSNLEMAGWWIFRSTIEMRASVYRPDTGFFLLQDYAAPESDPFDYLFEARAINEQGDIVGTAIRGTGGFAFYAQKLS